VRACAPQSTSSRTRALQTQLGFLHIFLHPTSHSTPFTFSLLTMLAIGPHRLSLVS
jgi:hypothetical protein